MQVRKWYVVATLALLSATAAVASSDEATAAAAPVCQSDEAEQWAQSNAASLPTTLQGFASLTFHQQNAVLRRLSIGEKAALWRDNVAQTLHESGVTLTPAQSALLLDFNERIEFLLGSDHADERMQFYARTDVFDKELRLRLFTHLGGITSEARCSCNNELNDCGQGPTGPGGCELQMHPNLACTPTSDGCGFLKKNHCNGSCMGSGGGLDQ